MLMLTLTPLYAVERCVAGLSGEPEPDLHEEEAGCIFRGTEIEVAVREDEQADCGDVTGCDWATECRDCLASSGVGLGFLLASRRLRSLRVLQDDTTKGVTGEAAIPSFSDGSLETVKSLDGSANVSLGVCLPESMRAGMEMGKEDGSEEGKENSASLCVSFEASRLDSAAQPIAVDMTTFQTSVDSDEAASLGSITRTAVTLRIFNPSPSYSTAARDFAEMELDGEMGGAAGDSSSGQSRIDSIEFVQYCSSVALSAAAWRTGRPHERAAIRFEDPAYHW